MKEGNLVAVFLAGNDVAATDPNLVAGEKLEDLVNNVGILYLVTFKYQKPEAGRLAPLPTNRSNLLMVPSYP